MILNRKYIYGGGKVTLIYTYNRTGTQPFLIKYESR